MARRREQKPPLRCRRIFLLGLAGLMAAPAVSMSAPMRAVRGIRVVPSPGGIVVDVHMKGAFRYLTHVSSSDGRVARIRLRPEESARALGDPARKQVVTWRNQEAVPLIDVEYDAEAPDGPIVILRFERPMQVRVNQGRDLEHIHVTVTESSISSTGMKKRTARRKSGSRLSAASKRMKDLVAEARKAMMAGEHGRAVLLLTKALDLPRSTASPEAQEMLGLARQRQGQLAHAKAEYEEYLSAYPDSKGAPRVRQRLDALLTARREPSRRPRRRRVEASAFQHDVAGSFAQYYRRSILDSDRVGQRTTQSSVDSDLYLSTRHTNDLWSIRTSFAGSYRLDLLDPDAGRATRFTQAYVDGRHRARGLSARIGRQSSRGGGVLGRFDGALVTADIGPRIRLNFVTGFPVEYSDSNRINDGRFFYGTALDLGTFGEHWDGQMFVIQQRVDGVEDRTAVGGEIRWAAPIGFWLGVVDYDLSYDTLNSMMFVGSRRIDEKTTVNVLADYRKSPVLTAYNALQGQVVNEIDDLRDIYSDSQIRDLAEDRTATSKMVTLGLARQVDSHWQVGGDLTWSNISGTSASGGVAATSGTGNEFYYAIHATETGLVSEGGYTIFGLRYSDADTSHRYAVNVGGRYPVFERLRIGPRVIVEFRDNKRNDNQWTTRPSLQADLRWRRIRFEGEMGVDWTKDGVNLTRPDETGYFFALGARVDF